MLTVLRDGKPHSRHEIFQRVGFMLTNNAASELRARGLDVEETRDGDNYLYQLAAALPAATEDHGTGVLPSKVAAGSDSASIAGPGALLRAENAGSDTATTAPGQLHLDDQPSLFDMPTRPAWG